jgi:predicted  nucleic acid-binding Zn-ribbon protein
MAGTHPLLELQRLDSDAQALRARRSGLPERAACVEREEQIAALARERAAASERRLVLGREERRVEALVADLEARAREVEGRLYSGKIQAIRELEGLQLELRDLLRRQGEQEEAELALLEQEEELARRVAALDASRAGLEAQLAELRAAIAAAEAAIDAELARLLEVRAGLAAQLDAALLARYERLRAAPPLRGRAAVRIAGDVCEGCRAALPIAFRSRLPREVDGATALCPRCGRILVL